MTFLRFQKLLGERTQKLRVTAGLTQEQAARKAGITRQHLQRLEYGMANPKAETLFELAKIYNLSIAELLNV
jgi:transcriptional regulator with XRE-family HTH domain